MMENTMNNKNRIKESADAIRRVRKKHSIKNSFRLLGFCLSLLPIPVIQQAGTALDRHLSDKALENELEKIWAKLEKANEAVAKVETIEEAITEIAQTVHNNQMLRAECERLSVLLANTDSKFVINTSSQSYQQIVNSVIQAGEVLISAKKSSINIIENTEVHSPNTHLHASEGSRNYIDGSTFTDDKGTVGMKGISTQGNIQITGNSIGFSTNSVLNFGGSPNEVNGLCPICKNTVSMDKRKLAGYSNVQCPRCKNILPFTIG